MEKSLLDVEELGFLEDTWRKIWIFGKSGFFLFVSELSTTGRNDN